METVNDSPNIEDEEWRLLERRNKSYQPKGSMCINCQAWSKDCSGLDFAGMKQIETTPTAIVVRCTEFEKQGES